MARKAAATKASQPTPPGTRIASTPHAMDIGATGYPPAALPGVNPNPPAAHMPQGPAVTHISDPSAWPSTGPMLGGLPPGAPASGGIPLFGNSHAFQPVDYPGLAYPPDTADATAGTVDWDDPEHSGSTVMDSSRVQTPAQNPTAQIAPSGAVTLPSGSVPQATAMEPAGEVPFRPEGTTETGR